MQIVRTVIWVLALVALLLFSVNNWQSVDVRIWNDLIWETRLPVLVILAFLLGLVPMWLLHRGARWRLTRRIGALENTMRATTAPGALDAANQEPQSPLS